MASADTFLEQQDVTNVVIAYAGALDSRDWDALHELFTDEVIMDSDLRLNGPATLGVDDMVMRIRGQVSQFAVTLHYLTNFAVQIDGHEATCRSYVYAPHIISDENGGGRFVAHGVYKHSLHRTPLGWRISGVKVSFKIRDGEAPLPKG